MYNWFEFTYRAMARLQKAAYWRQSCCFSSLANWPARQIVQREYTVFMAQCSDAILSIFVNKPIAKWTTSSLTELFARFGYIWLSQETPKERNRRFLYMRNVQKYWTLKTQQPKKTFSRPWLNEFCLIAHTLRRQLWQWRRRQANS